MAFVRAILEGVFWSALGLALIYVYADSRGAFDAEWQREARGEGYWSQLMTADFARRVDGTCTGWTKSEAMRHVAGDLLHWWAYVTIAISLWRLHPVSRQIPLARLTVAATGWFIMACGGVHLFSALTVFLPVYRIEGLWKITNGVVSAVSALLVSWSLNYVARFVRQRQAELEKYRGQA